MAAMSIRKRGSVKRAPVMENASEWEQMWRSRHKKEKKKLGQVESILRMNLWNSLRGQSCLREIFSSTYITNNLASSFKVLEKSWMSISLPKEVLDVNIITDIETGNSRGFGFVTMATVEEAKKGVELFNRYSLEGRLLTVNKAAPRGTKFERPAQPASTNKIYVGNLP